MAAVNYSSEDSTPVSISRKKKSDVSISLTFIRGDFWRREVDHNGKRLNFASIFLLAWCMGYVLLSFFWSRITVRITLLWTWLNVIRGLLVEHNTCCHVISLSCDHFLYSAQQEMMRLIKPNVLFSVRCQRKAIKINIFVSIFSTRGFYFSGTTFLSVMSPNKIEWLVMWNKKTGDEPTCSIKWVNHAYHKTLTKYSSWH